MSSGYPEAAVARWLAAVAPLTREAPAPDAARSALLVIDMQRYFAGIAAPILETVRRTVAACHERGVLVVFTRHGHVDPARDGGMLGRWWGELILEGTEGHDLLPLGAEPDDPVVPKRRYDAFFGTDLEALLRERGIEEVAVAGVMTNLCVETTARAAFVRDFRVRLLLDAAATAGEELHLASLVNLAFGFAHVQRAGEWVDALGAGY
jgi:nicotinamidase-related amidase